MTAVTLLAINLSSVTSAQQTYDNYLDTTGLIDIYNEKGEEEFVKTVLTSENPLTNWFPGFLIVQLIKGVIAFILVLLILFDIIEP